MKLFSKSKSTKLPECPPGLRLYCIGDIHGRVDLLRQMHEMIIEDAAKHSGRKKVVYLGDYIDRGEYSKEVVELLIEEPLAGFESVHLRGNHEQTMLDFLCDASIARSWFDFGGNATLVSYGVNLGKIPTKANDFEMLQQGLREKLPTKHQAFIAGTLLFYGEGGYYFAHAGINPKVGLKQQLPESLLWIRDEFLRYKKPLEKVVVHGHTVVVEPEFKLNRIGIDTGAYFSGRLSCLILENTTQRILQTHHNV